MELKLVESFRSNISEHLSSITRENFYTKYKNLEKLVLEYNNKGVTREEILNVLRTVYTNTDDDFKEELVGEILDCIEEFTSPSKIIKLKDF